MRLLLIVAMAIAPRITRPFLSPPYRLHDILHTVAFLLSSIALLTDFSALAFAWPMFCLFVLGLFARRNVRRPSPLHAAQAVPIVFGVVGALWMVCGTNDLRLLGYDTAFSYYAALHSAVLGWILVGAMATLATRTRSFRRVYTVAVFISLGAFFLIAFGIDRFEALKPIGVAGITSMVALTQVLFLFEPGTPRLARGLGAVTLLALVLTLTLAWMNHLGTPLPYAPFGVRAMVSVHGGINGLVVAPATLWALAQTPSDSESGGVPVRPSGSV